MSKITLTDLVNLQNETTAVNAINTNNAVLESALDNTLSRDGTSPNQMDALLDMNSNRIINLPEPQSSDEPARLADLEQLVIDGLGGATYTGTGKIVRQDSPTINNPTIVGNIPVTNLNGGVNANSGTFWAGDGTWKAPSGILQAQINATGSQSRTVNDKVTDYISALDFIPAGIRADVASGTYINDTASYLNLAFATGQPVKVDGYYRINSTVTIAANTTVMGNGTIFYTGTGQALKLNGNNITIKDITIQQCNITDAGKGLTAYNPAVYIDGNRAINMYDFALPYTHPSFNNIRIENVKVDGFREGAMYMGWVTQFVIKDNIFTNLGRNGWVGVSCQDGIVTGNIIDTLSPGQAGTPTLAYGMSFSRVYGFPILRTAEAPCSQNILIDNNIVKNNLNYVGIDLHGAHDVNITNNKTRNVKFGINLEHASMSGQCGGSGSSTTINLGTQAVNVDGYYNGCTIILTGGTSSGDTRTITNYVGATKIATVSSSFTATPDNTTLFSMWEPSGDALNGITTRNIVIDGNNLHGVEASSGTEAAIAVDAQSGAGEISEGITITGNIIHAHGLNNASAFYNANDGAIFARNVDGLVISSNVFRECYGRAVSLESKVRAATVTGNAVNDLAQITYAPTSTLVNNAFEIITSDSSATFDNNTLIASSALRMFAFAAPATLDAGAFVGQNNIALSGATMWQTNAKTNARGGSAFMAPSLVACWDSTGTIQYVKVNNIHLLTANFAVTSGGTGIWTVQLPTGLFENARPASFYSASDATSGEVMTSTVSANSTTALTCKSRNTSGAAVNASDNLLVVFGI